MFQLNTNSEILHNNTKHTNISIKYRCAIKTNRKRKSERFDPIEYILNNRKIILEEKSNSILYDCRFLRKMGLEVI